MMRRLAERCYEAAEERGQENFRFESIGVVSIVVWTDDDGDENEDTAGAFESKRHHVQTGILTNLLAHHLDIGGP